MSQQPQLSVGADSGTHTGTHIYQLVSKPHVLLSWPTVSLRRAHQTPALVSLVIVTLCFHQPFFLECQLMSLQLCTYRTGLTCALKISKLIDHFTRSCPTQAPSFWASRIGLYILKTGFVLGTHKCLRNAWWINEQISEMHAYVNGHI